MANRTEIENVSRVIKTGRNYTIRWVEVEYRNRTFSRQSKAAVEKRREELLLVEANRKSHVIGLEDLPLDGTSKGWSESFNILSQAAVGAARDGDEVAARRLSNLAETLSKISKADLARSDYAKLEDKFAEQTEYLKEQRRQFSEEYAKQQPITSTSVDTGMGRSDGPEDPLCRPGDQI